MNWFDVWTHIAAAIEQDEEIGAVLGRGEAMAFYLAGSRAFQVPSMEALLVVESEEEVDAPMEWQFTISARSFDDIVQVEKALRRLFPDQELVNLGSAEFRVAQLDGQMLPSPNADGVMSKLKEFRFTPVRSRYYRPQPLGE